MFRRMGDFKRCAACGEWFHLSEMVNNNYAYCLECARKKERVARGTRDVELEFFDPICLPEVGVDETIHDTVNESIVCECLYEALSSLTDREERVLRMRHGLGDGYPRTLQEVGSVFRVTRESARRIERKALRKMRHPTRARVLKSAIDFS